MKFTSFPTRIDASGQASVNPPHYFAFPPPRPLQATASTPSMSYPAYTATTGPAAQEAAASSRPPSLSQAPTSSTTAAPPALTKPPTDIHPTAHLDPSAYVLGTHPISLSPFVLIHPRARLVSTHGPLIIDSGAVISERCVIGGPAPEPSSLSADTPDPDSDPLKTTVGCTVLLHPNSTIHAGATLKESCIVEPHATVLANITVGAHAKVCAGVTVDRDVGDWEVVYGDGQSRRKRAPLQSYEDVRLRALEKDRDGTMALLKAAAAKALLVKRKG
jgi:carbonic anhydrase/acetyltransferase-like protein (isoleucine patch superfamily)